MADRKQLQEWADEAVRMSREDFGAKLDYTRESVVTLEKVLHELHKRVRSGQIPEADVWDRYAC